MNAKIWGRWVSRLLQQRRPGSPITRRRNLAVEALEDRVTPATISWTGAGTNANWANPINWNLGRAPLAGDDLIFGALAPATTRVTVNNLDGLPVFNSITIAASGYVINSSPAAPLLALAGSLNAGSNLGTLTISSDMQLVPPTGSPQQTITVNTGTNLVLGGHLSGNSNPSQAVLQTITKVGPGTLELTNDNSAYTGAFTLASGGGVVVISHPNALGLGTVVPGVPAAGTVTVNANSQLQLRNIGTPVNARLTLNGVGVAENGALLNIAGNNTWGGPITLDSDASIGASLNSALAISGLINDTGSGHSLTKEGQGRLILSRVGGNTYRGQTIVDDGVLTIRDPISLGAGADFTKPQSGTPQAGTIVNFNSVTGEAGTLQFEYVPNTLPGTDPSAILQNPGQPFHPIANPVIGFQVFNDLLTLNGPGFNNLGALSTLAGFNSWNGAVTLGSPPPTPGSVSVGASTGSELKVEGVISDPNRSPTLVKVLPGRVILNNANTYRGGTIVAAGSLNIRDSRGLGQPNITLPPPAPASNVIVRAGASLELEVDQGLDGTPLRSHGRNLGFDSVTGDGPGQEIAVGGVAGTFTISFKGQTTAPLSINATPAAVQAALNALSTVSAGGGSVTVTRVGTVYRVAFNGVLATTNQPLMTATAAGGATAVVNAIYGLDVINSLQAAGMGLNNGGALRSVSGINTYSGFIGLGDDETAALGSVGVDRDPRPGHDTPSADYFTFDHSLTIDGEITDTLINPPPASTLVKLGDGHLILPRANSYTDRTEIRDGWITAQNNSSLGTINPLHVPTLRPYTTIFDGAALHLKPLVSGQSLNLSNNFVVSGSGFTHDYGLINHAGAVQNIAGNNSLSGIIQLNGQAGFGVEQLTPPVPGEDVSQLVLTGYTWDAPGAAGGIAKLGSRRLVIQSPGTYTGDIDIKAGVLLAQNDSALGAKSAPSGSTGEVQGLIHSYELNGSFDDTLGGPPLAPQGGTLGATSYTFGPGQGLQLSGALPAANHYSIEMVFSIDSLTGANGSPWVNLVEFKNGQADTGLYSFDGALQFYDEVTGPSGAFTAGQIATLLITRDGTTNEFVGYVNGIEQIRFVDDFQQAVFSGANNIINFLIDDQIIPNENAGGLIDRIRVFDRPLTPAQLNPTGNVTVVQPGAALEIANSLVEQTQGLMGGLNIWGEHLVLHGQGNSLFGDAALTILSDNSPSTNLINDPVFATDNAWRGPITLGSDTTIQVGPNSRLVVTGAIDDEFNPLPSGSSLEISGGGVLQLAGANTYRGSTILEQGVLSIADGQALGSAGSAEVQTLALSDAAAGLTTFTLSFKGKTTAPILYSGDGPTDAAAIQTALNALASIGGSANIGGSATVTPGLVADSFEIELGGSLTGFNQEMILAAVVAGPGAAAVTERVAGSGGTEIADGASLQLVGAITVAGEPLLVHGLGGATPAVPTQWFQVGPEGIDNGATPGNQRTTGRITGSVADPRDPNIIYIATAGGGAWKTIDGGKTWRPLFDAIPERVSIQVNTAGIFTLSFGGQTTADLNGSSPTLAADIQAALNALSTVGGAGAHVTVTRAGNVYRVTFGGTLIGADVDDITSNNPGVVVTTTQHGKNPRFAMYVGSITMHPINPSLPGGLNHPENQRRCNILYLATGEPNATGDTFYGTGIYRSIDAGATWELVSGTVSQAVTVKGLDGTFALTFDGETTIDLPFDAQPLEVADALNDLATIGSIGGNVTVTQTPIAEVQRFTIAGGAGNFTLTFKGETTAALAFNATAAQVQAALEALTTVGAGNVLVTLAGATYTVSFQGALGIYDQPLLEGLGTGGATVSTIVEVVQGGVIFNVTFGGTLSNADVDLLTATTTLSTTATVSITAPFNPFDGQVISKIVIDPFSGGIYAASGDAVPARNERQLIDVWLNPGNTFTLSFTHPDANGNIVTLTTPAITVDVNDNVTRARIETALNNLATINGAASVAVVGFLAFEVTFGRNLANVNVAQLVASPGYGNPGVVMSTTMEGGVANVNGTTTASSPKASAPGIWRLQNGVWVNLTSIVSVFRSSLASTNQAPPAAGANPFAGNGTQIPNSPGPDDDYRMEFPQINATWTDVALVYTDISNNPNNGAVRGAPVLYAALGTTAGTEGINNAVFWSRNPTSAAPIWFVGDPGGSPFGNPPQAPTASDNRNANGFPKGQFAVPVPNGNPPPPPVPEIAFNGAIKLASVPIANTTTTELVTSTIFAAVSTPNGQLRGVWRTQSGGQSWTQLTTPSYLYSVGNFANAIIAANANTVFIGGQGTNAAGAQTILMTTDAGATWTDVSVDANGNGPRAGIHAFSLDSSGRLLVSTDGGLWRRDGNGEWTNLNGDLAISQMNGVASDPTRTSIILGGAQANGIAQFTNDLSWQRIDGVSGGPVAVDPNNALNLYAVSQLSGTNAVLRKSINGGVNWTTALEIGSPTAPLVVDPVNSSRVLVGGTILRESFNGGTTWNNLQVRIGNTRISNVHDVAIANAQGVFAVDPSFLQVTDQGANAYDADTIYVTDGNVIWLTKNHGQTWVNRTGPLPGSIVDIHVDPRNRDTIYAAISRFGTGRVFRSTDAGRTWTNISANLPNTPAAKVLVDPRNGFLYVGTDLGVFHSTDGGASWSRFGVGMPNVQVKELDLNLITNTLLAGTYGRSTYQLFLDTAETSDVPVSGVVRALGGSSVWAGNVIVDGDAATNSVTLGAYGVQNMPNSLPVASINFVGPISDYDPDRPGATVNKVGQGDVILSSSNIYSGQTIVQEGALVVDNPGALGLNNQGTTVVDGAVLELRSNLDAEPITLNGHGLSFNDHYTGSLRNVAGVNTYTGPLTLNTDATIGVDSGTQLTIAAPGSVQGTRTLTKESTGILALAAGNTGFSGAVNVNQGALRLEHSDALGSSPNARVLAGAQIQLNSPAGGPPVEIDVPLQLSGTGVFGTGALLNLDGDNAWNGPISLDSLPGFSAPSFPNGAVALGADGGTLTVGGAISQTDAVGITKVGAGRVSLTSPGNTFSGATEVLAGTLDIQDPGALGARTSLEAVQRIVTLSAERTGTFRLGFNGQLTGNLTWAADTTTVENALNALSTIGGVGGSVTVTRAEVQTFNQDGPIPLQGGDNGFGYVYTITCGGSLTQTTIPVTAAGQGGTGAAASVVATGGINVRVAAGATLELGSSAGGIDVDGRKLTLAGAGDDGVGALLSSLGDNTWSGAVELAGNASVGAAAGASITLDGGVVGQAADLTKVGDGTLNFPTAVPPNNQGRTIITDGTVDVDGEAGAVVLAGGTLAGTGEVGLVSTNGAGGAINPGDPADPTGTLSSAGGALDGNNTFLVDLIDSATSDNDLLVITDPIGTFNLGGAALGGTSDLNIQVGDSFTILQTANANGIIGQFAGPATNPEAGGDSATIAYIGGVKYVVDYFPDHIVVTRELANVSITLTPSIASPVYGDPLTFTAVLTPEPAAPAATGMVNFTFDGVNIPRPIVNGVATLDVTTFNPLAIGGHTISVAYNGTDSNGQVVFNPASAGPLTVVVAPAGTTTTIAASIQSPLYGESIIFTATVTSIVNPQAPNTLNPQGTVSFFRDGGILMGTGTLDASGVATFDTASLTNRIPVGSHTFFAVYNSDGVPDNYETSSSSTITRFIIKAGTQTSVTTSGSPTVFGEPVTFTATVVAVAPGSGVPTGAVTFRANGQLLGTGNLDGSGVATFTTTAGQLPAGVNYTITASYPGDSNFNLSSASTTQTVTRVNSTTALSSSANPAVFGQPVTLTATITAVAPGGGIATGVVTFKRDGVVIGTGLLDASGVATYTTTFGQLPLGAGAVITAEYPGDLNFNASSGSLVQDVINSSTTTAVSSSINPSMFGQPVTFTATVTPTPPGAGVPTGGTVTFTLGATTLGVVTLDSNGQAAYTTTLGQLPLGAGHVVTATYSGDAGFGASSGTVTQDVVQASTTTVVSASINPSGVDQPVTFTATVTPIAEGAPTGTVTFRVDGAFLGTGTLGTVGGITRATFTAAANTLAMGARTITAEYAGDANFLASTGALNQTVLRGTATALATSANPAAFGQPVTFTATVTATTPGGPTPTGQVTFAVNGLVLGTGTLNAQGVATLTTAPFTLGVGANQVVTATYVDTSSTPTYAGSTGTLLQTVDQSNTATSLTAAPAQGTRQRAFTFTVHVGASGAGSGIPTGTVTFTDLKTGQVLGTAAVDANGNAILMHHLGGPLGTHTVRANYAGDGNFGASQAAVSVRVIANGTRTSTVVLRTAANPSIVGQPLTLTATVRDSGALPRRNPGGSVMFFNRSTGEILGYANLAAVATGVTRASLTTTALDIGTHEIVARYSGNGLFARSNSAILEQVVKPVPTRQTSTNLTQSSIATAFGAPVTLTATVTDQGGGNLTPTGIVTFTYGPSNTVLGTVSLAQLSSGVGRALLVTTELPVGVHEIRASYQGDTDFAPGAPSNPLNHTVTKAASLIALSSTANPSRFGQAVTLRAAVTSSTGSGIPTGSVRFFVNGNEVGIGTINAAGIATFTLSSLAVGSYTVTASYAGDDNFTPSNGTLSGGQTVNKAATTARLARSTAEAGAPVTFTATILPIAPGGGVPTGTVTFLVNGIDRGTFGLTNGFATLFLPNGLPQGTHKIVVKYSGGDSHLASNTTFFLNFGGRTS